MKPAKVIFALILLSLVASASFTQQESVGIDAVRISSLVSLGGSLSFVPFVPEVENRANLTVSLAVPESSLSTIAGNNLTVYVLVTPKLNDSKLYFGANPDAKWYYAKLVCILSNGSCTTDSVTSRTFSVYFNADSEAALKDDGVLMTASTSPLLSEQDSVPSFAINKTAYDQLSALQQMIAQMASGAYNFSALGNTADLGNATAGALSGLSSQMAAQNLSAANLANLSANQTQLLQQALDLARAAQQRMVSGDYPGADRLANESASLMQSFRTEQERKANESLASSSAGLGVLPFTGLVTGANAVELGAAFCVIAIAAVFVLKYRKERKRYNSTHDSRGKDEFLEF